MKKIVTIALLAVMLLGSCGQPPVESTAEITEGKDIESVSEPIETDAPITEPVQETEPKEEVKRMDYKIKVKDDAYVFNTDGAISYADTNFGSESDLHIKSNSNALTRYTYLKFDISSLVGDDDFTDDSSLYAKYVKAPRLCCGEKTNVKLTYPDDFLSPTRAGFGVDTHAFGKEQDYIVLGGVKIPSASGLKAHSDGDVLLHAVMDALLSAVGLKDIGYYFPDNDDAYKGADSALLTKKVVEMVKEKGYGLETSLCITKLLIT